MDNKDNILIVTGPTASGKSRLAADLAERLGGEIVNADSVQFYRDFDLGSCKPSATEMARVPHHLYSCVSPEEHFDAVQFASRADEVIAEITKRGKLPIVVGGTGLYLRALLNGIVEGAETTEDAKTIVEERTLELETSLGNKEEVTRALWVWLKELDPDSAAKLQPTDAQRIRRSLLVRFSTGESFNALQQAHQHKESRYRAMVICLMPERDALYRRIDQRSAQLLEGGLLEETAALLKRYPENARAFQSIGYLQAVQCLKGAITRDDALSALAQATRNLAKRQFTWWRHEADRMGWKTEDLSNPPASEPLDSICELVRPFQSRDELQTVFTSLNLLY